MTELETEISCSLFGFHSVAFRFVGVTCEGQRIG